MTEIIFLIEDSIFTEADNLQELERNVRDAVHCHFDDEERPRIAVLHRASTT